MQCNSFAVLGAVPVFPQSVPVGQLYFPSWERYQAAMRGIFDRRYYTNQGPLVQQLEVRLQNYIGVKHVICVTNATIGLIMAAEALELSGKVIMPSFTFIASAQSLRWAGVQPVFCDVNPRTHQIDMDKLDCYFDDQVTAVMGINLWGGACDPIALEKYTAERDIKLYFDSAHAFGCEVENRKIGAFGSVEVFSFHATKVLSATEGGCLCTNDDAVAARLRNIRSSYGAGPPVAVVKTSNGRMSEAQAAIALMSLEDFPSNQRNNEFLFNLYRDHLKNIAGVKLIEPAGVTFSNYQYLICEIDEAGFGLSRDQLISVLKAEGVNARRYFYPGTHRSIEFKKPNSSSDFDLPVTDYLCGSCLQLPIGALVDRDAVEAICSIVERAHTHSGLLREHLSRRAS